jgi:PAS domain S-box-containing protein
MKEAFETIHHQLVLDSMAEGVCSIDQDWRITMFNPAAEIITGREAQEVLGAPIRTIFDPKICRCIEVLEEVMEKGTQMRDLSIRIRRGGDRIVPIQMNLAPIIYEDTIFGVVMVFRDMSDVEDLRKELECDYCTEDIVGQSTKIRELLDILPAIADSISTVMILGESGTGKELFARAIHRLSPRCDGPFVAINCAALPDNLLESELFGYQKGAFTDAKKDKPGRFARAEGGSLFLDEIGEISQAMQVKLLRVLQERVYEPLGGTETVETDVRIIAATNKNLKEMVQKGEFRADLYYRIHVVELQLPPLRERSADIPMLVHRFLEKFNARSGKNIRGISTDALSMLRRYSFPGNIRELENIIERAYAVCPFDEIQAGCLPPTVHQEIDPDLTNPPPRGSSCLDPTASLDARRKELPPDDEQAMIRRALEENHGHRRRTADQLGIDPSTLWRKMKKYSLL